MIKEVLTEYLEEEERVAAMQHGFQGGRSTLSNVMASHEHLIRELESGHAATDSVFLDLDRAFDRAPHWLILKML